MILSIPRLKNSHAIRCIAYQDDLLVTNRIADLTMLKAVSAVECTTVFVCLEGVIDCEVNLKHYHVKGGMIMVIISGDVVKINSASGVEAYAVMVSNQYLHDLRISFEDRAKVLLVTRLNAAFNLGPDTMSLLSHYYPLYAAYMGGHSHEMRNILMSLVRAFAYTIIDLVETGQPSAEMSGQTRSRQILDEFLTLLVRNHARERSVKFYAEAMCMSPKYLSSAVKEASGRGALEWINDYVLLEAKVRLTTTNTSIKEIAFALNFQNQSAFGKYFKQQLGISPKAYREEKRE